MQSENQRKVAIVGAGFSGLAVAWQLLQFSFSVTIFDVIGIGGGASGIAAGLMHPYPGLHAKLNWMGLEGCHATQQLLKVAENALGHSVYQCNGLLRVAITEEQQKNYRNCSIKHSEVVGMTADECSKLLPSIVPHEGIFIPSGMVINSALYLEGLWQACSKKGGRLIKEKITHLNQLKEFDAIVIAAGVSTQLLLEEKLPLAAVKGQIIELFWPKEIAPPSIPINSQAYLLMNAENETCILGATFEREFNHILPDLDRAKQELYPKIEPLFPHINKWGVKECRAGVRCSTPDHRPIVKRVKKNCWVLTGMGSKGLLYHALFAQEICRQITLFI